MTITPITEGKGEYAEKWWNEQSDINDREEGKEEGGGQMYSVTTLTEMELYQVHISSF